MFVNDNGYRPTLVIDTSTLLTDIEVEDINLCNGDGDIIRDNYSTEYTIQHNNKIVKLYHIQECETDRH